MGYRSTVYIMLPKEYSKELEKTAYAEDGDKEWWDYKYPWSGDDSYIVYELQDRKWYDNYHDVQFFENFVSSRNTIAEAIDSDRLGAIFRLGEEFGDYEVHVGDPYSDFEIYPEMDIIGL